MIKRTLYFGNEAYLSTTNRQLVVSYPNSNETKKVPIEDIGVLLLDHYRLTLTSTLLNQLLGNNVAVITCDAQHLPLGMFLNLNGHSQQQEHFEQQIAVTTAKKDRLWKQTIQQKIQNQAAVLQQQKIPIENMLRWKTKVQNGDPDNLEARAAAYYWSKVFVGNHDSFRRGRFEAPPNHLLNYGYSILRGVVARALVASGLLPSFGIHHHNKYNAYCLADDVMEPYRPFVDLLVLSILEEFEIGAELSVEVKSQLLQIPVLDVHINGRNSPLMIAVQQTTSSLQKCYTGERKLIKYPSIV